MVVSLTNCPPKLRGDLSKWLMEINTNVYVGNVSPRVRDALWKRICGNVGSGQATMVFTADNEQHMDFYVHNTSWKPVDYDGIKLMKHMSVSFDTTETETGFSDEAKRRLGKKRRSKMASDAYIVLDIETTGLSYKNDDIIEIGAVSVSNGEIADKYEWLIQTDKDIPEEIQKLTGIGNEMLDENGISPEKALTALFKVIGGKTVIIYNAGFDMGFLEEHSKKYRLEFPEFNVIDVLDLVRSRLKGLENYRLKTVAGFLDVRKIQRHRAVDDCRLLNEVYKKINEM